MLVKGWGTSTGDISQLLWRAGREKCKTLARAYVACCRSEGFGSGIVEDVGDNNLLMKAYYRRGLDDEGLIVGGL